MTKRITRTRPEQRADGNIHGSARIVTRGVNESNQIQNTDFVNELLASSGFANIIIDPPYNVLTLFELVERSNIIPQCVDAMVTNTVTAGWEVAPIRKGMEMDDAEKEEAESFIEHANSEESLSTVVGRAYHDRYAIGFGFIEVIRDAKDDVAILRSAPALITRLTAKHPVAQKVKYDIQRGSRTTTVVEFKRFRKYVQTFNGKVIWFKEFGDPRKMNSVSGLFEGDQGYVYDPENIATEIYHVRRQSNDPYGTPDWLGLVPALIGSREAEECNMRFFEDNTVPPVMVTVAGGRLTGTSFKEIQRVLKTGGKDKQNRMVLIEAVSDSDSLDKSNTVQIKVDKLTSERPSDGLFKEYKEGNQADVRSSYRLPPVSVGMSQDVSFATANVSQFVAETQVFRPARDKMDEGLNNLIINGRNGLRLKTCKLVARTPTISSPEMVMKALTALNVIGAVTPREAQRIANSMLQIELTPYPEKGEDGYEDWMDKPMPLTVKETTGNSHDGPVSNTHDEQAAKDPSLKGTEGSGDVGQSVPKHGTE